MPKSAKIEDNGDFRKSAEGSAVGFPAQTRKTPFNRHDLRIFLEKPLQMLCFWIVNFVIPPKVSTLGCEAPSWGFCFFAEGRLRTYIYIDGFNCYYGAVKGTPFKWLDFKAFFACLLKSNNQIVSIKYFTALVSATPDDPDKPIRQETFIRALKSYILEVVVSNDSDLAEAMRLVKEHHSRKLPGLVTPGVRKTSKQLQQHADFVRKVRRGALA
ncbi:MAG: NYN domain-containing protein, partial [Candidatus Pacebacteria bacterium]|nr:NYN domain-containing protein [Candidatus Paceibacterota bacterium]